MIFRSLGTNVVPCSMTCMAAGAFLPHGLHAKIRLSRRPRVVAAYVTLGG
jgi:hypothetical protein